MAKFWQTLARSTPTLDEVLNPPVVGPPSHNVERLTALLQAHHENNNLKNRAPDRDYTRRTPLAKVLTRPLVARQSTVYCSENICVATGQKHLALQDFHVNGPIPLLWIRYYSSADSGIPELGHGWRHSFSDHIHKRDSLWVYTNPQGETFSFHELPQDETLNLIGTQLCIQRPSPEILRIWSVTDEVNLTRQFHRVDKDTYRLAYISDTTGNYWECVYEGKNLVRLQSSWGVCLSLLYFQNKNHYPQQYPQLSKIVRGKIMAGDNELQHPKVLVQYHHDKSGNLITAKDAANYQERYQYQHLNKHQDQNSFQHHLLTRHTLKTGFSYHFDWQQDGEHFVCIRCWGDEFDGEVFRDCRIRYETKQCKTIVSDSRGGITEYQLDHDYLVTQKLSPKGQTTHFDRDDQGRILSIRNASGPQMQFTYDELGRVIQSTDALGQQQTFTYNARGQLLQVLDATGQKTKYTYNDRGLIASHTDALGHTLHYSYTSRGLVHEIVDDDGDGIQYRWNSAGQLFKYKLLDEPEIHLEYTPHGEISRIRQNDRDTWTFAYDALGRIVETNSQYFGTASCRYNALGQLAQKTLPDGDVYQFQYDSRGLLSKQTAPGNRVVKYHYNSEGMLTQLINEAKEWFSFDYDLHGNMVEEIGFDGRIKRYKYNALDQMVAVYDCVKTHNSSHATILETTTFERDALGRLTEKTTSDGVSHHYAYNPQGKLAYAANPNSSVSFIYDALGRLTTEIQGDAVIQHEYDQHNRKIATYLPDNQVLRFKHDNGEKQTWLNDKLINQHCFDDHGRETERHYGNGLSNFYDYDAQGRLTEQKVNTETPAQAITRFYQYDEQSHLLTSIDDSKRGLIQYQYNTLKQLTSVDSRHPEHLSYDAKGNLVKVNHKRSSSPLTGNRLNDFGIKQFRYDHKGNRTSTTLCNTEKKDEKEYEKNETHFQFNALNQLIAVTRNKQEEPLVRYEYDALGRRTKKIGPNGTVDFLWNGDQLLGELRGNDKKLYIFEEDSFTPMALVHNETLYHIQTDHLGTPQELLNENGELVWAAYYQAFGEINQEYSQDIACPLRFQGQYFDEETGLHYNRHRYYDPSTASYISQDPIGLEGGINLYQYVPNPVAWVDPLGLSEKSVWQSFSEAMSAPREIGLTIVSGMVSEVSAGVTGIATLALTGGNVDASIAVMDGVRDRLTYNTNNSYAIDALGAVGEALAPLDEGLNAARMASGDYTYESSNGSALAGAAGYIAPDAALELGTFGLGKLFKRLAKLRKKKRDKKKEEEEKKKKEEENGATVTDEAGDEANKVEAPNAPITLTMQKELAHLTTQARDELVNDFDKLLSELSPSQIDAIAEEPWRMSLYFGTAVETRVARQIDNIVQNNPDHVLSGVQWTGITNAPQDFIGPDNFGFDITGQSTSSIKRHLDRPEIDSIVTYESIPKDLGYSFIQWLEENI